MVSPVAWVFMFFSLVLSFAMVLEVFFDLDVLNDRNLTIIAVGYVVAVIGALMI